MTPDTAPDSGTWPGDAAPGSGIRPVRRASGPGIRRDDRVVAVVVAYNRAELLAQCLDALAGQQRPVDRIVVIDNASTDDTATVAAAHPARPEVVTLAENTGGAGGFAAGIQRALKRGADSVWLMDDDTIPTPTALGELLDACERYDGSVDVAGSRVLWRDGRDHPMNTPRPRPGVSARQRATAAEVGAIPIRSTSFVSMLASADAIRHHGLPVADYFIWNDDFEYSTRLLRRGTGLHVRASVVEHWTKTFGATDADPGGRFYYEVRNKLWLFARSRALSPAEKLLYGGSTLRRWARTVAKSPDRSVLLRAARRGMKDSLAPPLPTAEILAGAMPRPERAAGSNADYDAGAGDGGAGTGDETARPLPFSLLLPVYRGDDAEFFRRAFDSATTEQTRRPSEVVLVQDGPVGEALAAAISESIERCEIDVIPVILETNRGLARALEAGLARCRYEVVARADADDISTPERFATQLPVIEAGADLVGSALVEFADDEQVTGQRRVMPTGAREIARLARFADPFNHPTVVYRKSAVEAAGGYQDLHLMEDYLLFARMIGTGARVANVPDVLVKYRVGAGAYDRRGGRALARSELRLQRALRRAGFTTRGQYVRNMVVRGGYRLVPVTWRRRAYRMMVARRG